MIFHIIAISGLLLAFSSYHLMSEGADVDESGCPVGWKLAGKMCYGAFLETGVAFKQAHWRCKEHEEGMLASFWDSEPWTKIAIDPLYSGKRLWFGREKRPCYFYCDRFPNGSWWATDKSSGPHYIPWQADADLSVHVIHQNESLGGAMHVIPVPGNVTAHVHGKDEALDGYICAAPAPQTFGFAFNRTSPEFQSMLTSKSSISLVKRVSPGAVLNANRTVSTFFEDMRATEDQCAALCLLEPRCSYFAISCGAESNCFSFRCDIRAEA